MDKTDKEKRLNKAIIISLIWMGLWFLKIFLFGGSPFILLISTSLVFLLVNAKK
jgi:hypothetical protein